MQLAIAAAERADLEAVMSLLREARGWHEKQGVDAWREFDSGSGISIHGLIESARDGIGNLRR